MNGTTLKGGRVIATAAALALALGGGALLWARPAQRSAPAAEAAKPTGKKIYAKWCGDCHSTETGPGSFALQRKYQGDPPAVLERRTDLSPDYVKVVVRQGISFMPSFRKTEISEAELALVADYLTHAQSASSAKEGATKKPAGSKRK